MYLSSDVHICDIDHQNSMSEIIFLISTLDINSQFMIHVNRSFNQLHDKII